MSDTTELYLNQLKNLGVGFSELAKALSLMAQAGNNLAKSSYRRASQYSVSEEMLKNEPGKVIHRLRTLNNIEISEICRKTDIRRYRYLAFETGKRKPHKSTVKRIIKAMGYNIKY